MMFVLVVVGTAEPVRAGGYHPNPIVAENALAGTSAWHGASSTPQAIEGYVSEVSAAPGDTIHFHISTRPAARYRIELYRLGWYGGRGGRLVACLPSCNRDTNSGMQALPPQPNSADLQAPGR